MSSTEWVKFFEAAGLPGRYAARYAVIFADHRIQKDMLKDLSKEILYDMGIKTIGDVIAILRHAKDAEEEETRAKLLGANGLKKSTSSTAPPVKAAPPVVASTAATPSVNEKVPTVKKISNSISNPAVTSSSGISDSLAKRLGPAPVPRLKRLNTSSTVPLVKKRIVSPAEPSQPTQPATATRISIHDRLTRPPNTHQSGSVFSRLG